MGTGRNLTPDRKAVSPVIGVILMVAITVILAAVIGTMVMDLGNNVQQNAQAGISYTNGAGNTAEVQLTDLGNVDDAGDIEVQSDGCSFDDGSGPMSFGSIGDTISLTCSEGDRIIVVGSLDDSDTVVGEYTYEG